MLTDWIKNSKERKLVYLATVIALVILGLGFWMIAHRHSLASTVPNHFRHPRNLLTSYARNKASLGRLCVFAAFAMFPLYFLLRTKKINLPKELKKFISILLKWVKLFHVPISVIAFALITVHSIIMVFYNWHTDAVDLTGVLSYLLLLPLGVFGFLRYKRKDKNWHYYLSFAFVFSMLLHTFI